MDVDDERDGPGARPPGDRDRDHDRGRLEHADLPVVPHQRAPLGEPPVVDEDDDV